MFMGECSSAWMCTAKGEKEPKGRVKGGDLALCLGTMPAVFLL